MAAAESFIGSFEEKLTRRVKLKRWSFITQFKIEFLLLFTGCRKVLRKMPVGKFHVPGILPFTF